MRSPDGISCWFWLKGIVGRDLRLAQPHTGYWFWLKGIAGWDLRLAQPRRFWFWFKEIVWWDLRLRERKWKRERNKKKEKKKRNKVIRWVNIQQVRKTKRQVFLYKAYYAKHWGVLLRKHCKEGASVATQFLTHVLINFQKKSKNSEKHWKPKKIHF